MSRENVVGLFTEDELILALTAITTPVRARQLAAELYSKPVEEQSYYDWIDTTLVLFTFVSEDCAERVRRYFGWTEQDAEAVKSFEQIIKNPSTRNPSLELGDIVYDSRLDEV